MSPRLHSGQNLRLAAPTVVLALTRTTILVRRAHPVLRQAAAIGVVTCVTARTATSVAIAAGDIGKSAHPAVTSVDRANVTVVAVRGFSATTINPAIDLVLAPFADAVSAAEGDRRRITAAIHGAVGGLLARAGANAVSTTGRARATTGTSAVRRATETVLAVSAADSVSARAAAAADAVTGAVVAVFARLADAVIIADRRLADAVHADFAGRTRIA